MKIRYVYYNKKTGQITDILDKRKPGRLPYIKCPVEEVIGFMDGSYGINDFIVAYDHEKEIHSLFKKNNVILFRKQNKKLYKIPYKKNVESDLRIVYYLDNVLGISINMTRISPLYQTNFKKEVKFEPGTEIRIILKEKDSGNFLREIIINAQQLLESVQMFFQLDYSIQRDNVEFFTYKMFESYSWSKGNIKLISPMEEKIKFEIHKADTKRRSKDFDYHLIIKPTETGLEIKNNIESAKMIRFHKNIEFFIVDKHDPNILHEKFFLYKKDIESETILINLKTDAKDRNILYNHKYISVLKE